MLFRKYVFSFFFFASLSTCVLGGFWDDIIKEDTWKQVYSSILNAVPAEKITNNDNSQSSPVTIATRRFDPPKCGRSKIDHKGLILNSSPTRPGDWPWHTALFRARTAMGQKTYLCGGTLLTKNRILTAGHCVVHEGALISPETLYALLGKYSLETGDDYSREVGIYDIIVHSDYSSRTLSNDIAILKLASIVTFTDYIQPICLLEQTVNKATIVNKRGTVVGWGLNEHGVLSDDLRKATMLIVNDVRCIKSDPLFYTKFLSDYSYCAGDLNGTSVCNGDSGGGMYFSETDEDGLETWYMRGIVSLAVAKKNTKKCDPNKYVLFTDSAQYLDFIKNLL